MAAAAEELEPGEAKAMDAIAKGMHEVGQMAKHMAEGAHSTLSAAEYLLLRPPPAHLGQALPRAFLDMTGGILSAAVALTAGPVLSTLAGARHGARGVAAGVADTLKYGIGAPAVGVYSACRELCLGAVATPGAIAESLGRGGLCVAARARSEKLLKVAIATCLPAARGDIQPVLAVARRLRDAGAVVRIFVAYDKDDASNSFIKSFDLDVALYMSFGTLYDGVKAFSPKLFLHRWSHLGIAWVLEEQLGIASVEYSMWPEPRDTTYRFELVDAARNLLSAHLGVKTLSDLSQQDVPARMSKQPLLYAFDAEITGYASIRAGSAREGFHVTGSWDFTKDEQEGLYRSPKAAGLLFGSGAAGELEAFLEAGEPPVFVGWGALTGAAGVSQADLAAMAVRVLRLLGRRGIIQGSYRGMGHHDLLMAPDAAELEAYSKESVLWARWLPHQWLLPRCRAAVHHGGAGTTAASLRAGLPTVVTPVMLDQFFWGYHVERLGVGGVTPPLKAVDTEALAAALRKCEEPEVVARAAALGERLREEDGAAAAARWILDFARPREFPELAGAEPGVDQGGAATGPA